MWELLQQEHEDVRHGFILLPHHTAALRQRLPRDDPVAVRGSLIPTEEQQRWRTRPVRRRGGTHERVTQPRQVAVKIPPRRIRRPDPTAGEVGVRLPRGPRLHDVVVRVGRPRRQRQGQVRPGGDGGETARHGRGNVAPVPMNCRSGRLLLPPELQEHLQERKTQIGAGTVAGEDDGGGPDGGVGCPRRWVQQGEVGDEEIEQRAGEGRLRRESVLHGETSSAGQLGQPAGDGS